MSESNSAKTLRVPASPGSESNYSSEVRERNKRRQRLQERDKANGRDVEMNTEEEDSDLEKEALGDARDDDDEGCHNDPAPMDDADPVQDAADYEDPSHRAAVRQGKRKAGPKPQKPAKSTKPPKHGKVIDAGLQDLWVTVNEKAKALGKTPAQALADAGFVISLGRRYNSWNVYRTWLCLQPNRPSGMIFLYNFSQHLTMYEGTMDVFNAAGLEMYYKAIAGASKEEIERMVEDWQYETSIHGSTELVPVETRVRKVTSQAVRVVRDLISNAHLF